MSETMKQDPDLPDGTDAEEEVDPRPFVMAGLGLGEDFMELDQDARAEVLKDVEGAQLRRHLGRAIFYVLLVTAFVFALEGVVLFAAAGAVAMIAGRDLGRFAHGRRLLAAARGFFLGEDGAA